MRRRAGWCAGTADRGDGAASRRNSCCPRSRGRGAPRRTPPGPEWAGRRSGRCYPMRIGWTSHFPRPSRTGPWRPSAPPRRGLGRKNSPGSRNCMVTVRPSRTACLPAPLLAPPRTRPLFPPPRAASSPRSRLVRAGSPTQGHHPLGCYVSKKRGGGELSSTHVVPLPPATTSPWPCPRPSPQPRSPTLATRPSWPLAPRAGRPSRLPRTAGSTAASWQGTHPGTFAHFGPSALDAAESRPAVGPGPHAPGGTQRGGPNGSGPGPATVPGPRPPGR